MQRDRLVVCAGVGAVVLVVVLTAFVIVRLGAAGPEAIAGVLIALGVLLGAVPPIIRALDGR